MTDGTEGPVVCPCKSCTPSLSDHNLGRGDPPAPETASIHGMNAIELFQRRICGARRRVVILLAEESDDVPWDT